MRPDSMEKSLTPLPLNFSVSNEQPLVSSPNYIQPRVPVSLDLREESAWKPTPSNYSMKVPVHGLVWRHVDRGWIKILVVNAGKFQRNLFGPI